MPFYLKTSLLFIILLFIILKVSLTLSDSESLEVSTFSTTEGDNGDNDEEEDDHAPSCVTSNDCLQPIGSFCFQGGCRCKIFYTDQKTPPVRPKNSSKIVSSTSKGSTGNPTAQQDSVCVPIRCGSTEDCGVGQGQTDYRAELLTCVSSVCQCKTPLVLVDSDTRCGYPVWVHLFKWGGFLSLAAILIGTLACCCRWCGLMRLCTGGNGRSGPGANGVLGSSSMVTIKSAAIIGRKPAPPPPKLTSTPTPPDFQHQQQKKEKGEH